MMKPRVIALAAATVFGLSSAFTLHAVATPTPTATSTPTAAPTAEPTETGTWKYPQATFKGRTVTITDVKPGWKVHVAVMPGGEGPQVAAFSATAQPSGSVTIQLTGFPAGTYDIWVSAGDVPANESFYPKVTFGPDTTPKKPRPGEGGGGLAKTGV